MKIRNGFSLKAPPPKVLEAERDKKLRQAAQMYESYFLDQMVKAMRKTVPQDNGLFKKTMADSIYRQQLDQQYVKGWVKQGGIGIADLIYNQLKDQLQTHAHMPLPHPHGLPIHPTGKMHGLKEPGFKILPTSAQNELHYRFEAPGKVQAPLAGRIVKMAKLDNGWVSLQLDHGQGLHSELTFPGRLDEFALNQDVGPGQKLGELDPARPVLDWRLAWNLDSDISV